MTPLEDILSGGDLRSIGRSHAVVSSTRSQQDIDRLFACLWHTDRLVVMRAADAVEKVTMDHPDYLATHKRAVLELCRTAKDKELQWHLALLVPRLPLTPKELGGAWQLLTTWAHDKSASRIVRVNALQALFDLLPHHTELKADLQGTLQELEGEPAPSLRARIRRLRKQLS